MSMIWPKVSERDHMMSNVIDRGRLTFTMYFKKKIMKIDQIEAVISAFEVPGSKWNLLLPGTSS